MDQDWRAVWEAALDELELSLDAADRLLAGVDGSPLPAWVPPQVPGPMPADLRTRALLLHHRQQAAVAATTEAVTAVRRQAALAGRMHTGAEQQPVYVDITA